MDGLNAYGIKVKHATDIDGLHFETTIYPSSKAIDLMPFMISLASGPAGVLTDLLKSMGMGGALQAGDTSGREVREGLLTLAEQIVKHGGARKLREILELTLLVPASGPALNCAQAMDEVFQGRITTLIKVVAWVLEVNFAPFLREKLGDYKRLATHLWHRLQQDAAQQPSDSTSAPANGST